MIIDVPYDVGDEIVIDGEPREIKGLHVFIDRYGEVLNVRAYIGGEVGGYAVLMRKTKDKTRRADDV